MWEFDISPANWKKKMQNLWVGHKIYWVDKTQDDDKKKYKKTHKKNKKTTKNNKKQQKNHKKHKNTKKTPQKPQKTQKNTHKTTLKNKTMSITDLIKKQWYTQVLAKGKQFLVLIRHSQSYVYPLKVLSMREEIIILCKWEIYIAMWRMNIS